MKYTIEVTKQELDILLHALRPLVLDGLTRLSVGPHTLAAEALEDRLIKLFAGAAQAEEAQRLAAAAPELLAALKQCLTLVDPHLAAWDDGRAGIEAARAAIAKAEEVQR